MEFKLGPIQEKWLKSLEDHPERQMAGRLGLKTSEDTYTACCLGEAGLIAGVCEWNEYGMLLTKESNDDGLLSGVYYSLGLRSASGKPLDTTMHDTLASLNDNGHTWPQIAKLLREHPEQYFTESV